MTWSKKLFVPRAYTLASKFLMFSRNTISGRWTRMYPSTPLRVGIVLSRLVSSYSMSRLKIRSRSSSWKPDRPVVLSALASLQLKPLARMSTSGIATGSFAPHAGAWKSPMFLWRACVSFITLRCRTGRYKCCQNYTKMLKRLNRLNLFKTSLLVVC